MSALAEQVEIFEDAHELARKAADWLIGLIAAKNGLFHIALTGGNTPRELYTILGSERFHGSVDWDRVKFFWGDERFVPASDANSNYRMAHETLLSRISVPAQNIHPIPTDGDPDTAAQRYEEMLRAAYDADTFDPAQPLFDLVLLGLGSDGHIASLLPGSAALDEKNRWTAAVKQGRPEPRITLTYPALESCRTVAFVVTGPEKAAAVRGARARDPSLPAGRLRQQGKCVWFLDSAAAGA